MDSPGAWQKTWQRDASTYRFAARQVLPASQWPQLLAQHLEHPAARRHVANQSRRCSSSKSKPQRRPISRHSTICAAKMTNCFHVERFPCGSQKVNVARPAAVVTIRASSDRKTRDFALIFALSLRPSWGFGGKVSRQEGKMTATYTTDTSMRSSIRNAVNQKSIRPCRRQQPDEKLLRPKDC